MIDGFPHVTGISLDKCIEFIYSNDDHVNTSNVMEDFMFVYRYFITPSDLFTRLTSKYPFLVTGVTYFSLPTKDFYYLN